MNKISKAIDNQLHQEAVEQNRTIDLLCLGLFEKRKADKKDQKEMITYIYLYFFNITSL